MGVQVNKSWFTQYEALALERLVEVSEITADLDGIDKSRFVSLLTEAQTILVDNAARRAIRTIKPAEASTNVHTPR